MLREDGGRLFLDRARNRDGDPINDQASRPLARFLGDVVIGGGDDFLA